MDERALFARLCAGALDAGELAAGLGISRAAAWKRVEALRAAGLAIDARPGGGYALASPRVVLDAAAIAAARQVREDWPAAIEVAWQIDSTNAELLRRAEAARGADGEDAAPPLALFAERQSAGRGRRGRAWSAPLGGALTFSLGLRFEAGLSRLGGLSLAVGVAVAEALRGMGWRQVGLKWPNDLVVRDADGGLAKLGGLLVEVRGEAAGPVRAVIGLGLNIALGDAARAAIGQPVADLAGLERDGHAPGDVPDRVGVAAALLDALLPALAAFEREGLAPALADFAALDALAGAEVELHAADGVHPGRALGLSPDGGLRVRHADGERTWHAGEVSLRARPGAG